MTWYFRLQGDDFDIQALQDLFKEEFQLSILETVLKK